MPHAERIIGLLGLKVERVRHKQGIQAWATPSTRPNCYHCGHAKVITKATYERVVKHTRQGNQIMTLRLRMPKYYCPHCQRIAVTVSRVNLPVIKPLKRIVWRRLKLIIAASLSVHYPVYQISPATVERWYHHHITLKRSEMSNSPYPRVLGIDEHFFTRKKGYTATFFDLHTTRYLMSNQTTQKPVQIGIYRA